MKELKDKVGQNVYEGLRDTPKSELSKQQKQKLFNIEKGIVRQIIIGIIVDDDFCRWSANNFPPILNEVSEAQLLMTWVHEYFNNYQKAPKKEIETIFEQKKKKLQKIVQENIGDTLSSLNQECEECTINFDRLKVDAEKHLNKRIAETKIETASKALENNEWDEVNILLNIDPPTSNDLDQFIKTVSEMEAEGIEKPKLLMKPLIREGETTLLYSEAGVGKSLFAILLAYAMGLEKYDDWNLNGWQVKNPTGTLYIDGELGSAEMKDRIKRLNHLGNQKPGFEIRVFSVPEHGLKTGKDFDLSKRAEQRKITHWLKQNPNYKFLIIDSVSTVFNLENESDNSEWNKKVNPFIRDLRALGVAHIIQHHAGKDVKRGLRGASAMSAMAHNILRLTNHPNKETGQAWFKVDADKQRAAGKLFEPFFLQFNTDDEKTVYEITGSDKLQSLTNQIKVDLLNGMKQVDVARKYNKHRQNINKIYQKLEEEGLIKNKKTTAQGFKYLEGFNDDEYMED